MPLAYAFLLLVLFAVLVVIEFLIPSAGLITLCAIVSLIASVIIAFTHSVSAGIGFIVASMILTPLLLSAMIRIWPRTFFGRQILNLSEQTDRPPAETPFHDLIGCTGRAITDLLPSGLIEVNGKRLDAVSMGDAIDRQNRIKVVSVDGGKIHVCPIEKEPETPSATVEVEPGSPGLETPVETLGTDPLDIDLPGETEETP